MQRTKDPYIGKIVRITQCWCMAPAYFNLKPNTFHYVTPPPPGYVNNKKGVWVKGIGEIVRIEREEYNFVKYLRTKSHGKNK